MDQSASHPPFEEVTAQFESNGLLRPTANQAGWHMNTLDQLGEEFINLVKTTKLPILDLAVSYGFTTKCLLATGATVVANDIHPEMLDELEKSVSQEDRKRLTITPGNAVDLEFPEGSFGAVWANRFVHYLRPEEFRILLRKCFHWLAPGGILCINAASIYFREFDMAAYEERRQKGHEFPGYFEIPEDQRSGSQWCGFAPHFNCFSVDVMEREVKQVGFQIDKLEYIARPFAGNTGKEAVGIIARKPS